MTVQDKTTLKSYFADGHPPVEANYVDLIDSMALSNVPYTGAYLSLPGIHSFWNLASRKKVSTTIYVPDIVSGKDLTKNNGPLASVDGLAPRLYFDGSNDYLSYPDDSHFHVSGSESDVDTAYRGVTIGCWINPSVVGEVNRGLIGKWTSSTGEREYLLYTNASGRVVMTISQDGSATASIANTQVVLNTTDWFFVLGTWSNSLDYLYCYVNERVDYVATTYTAINVAGTTPFEIGRYSGAAYYQGWMSNAFICSTYMPPQVVANLYNQTKYLFQ